MNVEVSGIVASVSLVLIDTWWNVNVGTITGLTVFEGFNRYMVECECLKKLFFHLKRWTF